MRVEQYQLVKDSMTERVRHEVLRRFRVAQGDTVGSVKSCDDNRLCPYRVATVSFNHVPITSILYFSTFCFYSYRIFTMQLPLQQ